MIRSPRLGLALFVRALLMTALVAVLPSTGWEQLSSPGTGGSTCTNPQANNGDGYSGCGVAITTNTGTTVASRYEFNVNADTGVFSTRDESSAATNVLSFNATAPGGYRLDISTSRSGNMSRVNDASGCNGQAQATGISGSSNIALSSGSLSLSDPGDIGNGGSTTNTSFGGSSSAQIFRQSNGSPQGHSLTFTWSASVRSNSCEASVRMGNQNGTTSGCSACGYPGSPSRTQATDGHFVSVSYTSLCGNGSIDGSVGEACDQGAANGTAGSCCASNCQFKTNGTACTDDGNVCTNDICNGASVTCQHPNNTASCSDGIFCNGTDTCGGGSCSVHAGNPCPGADGDSDCSEGCNEAADNCTLNDPNGSACTDGLFCNGTDTCNGGSCANHAGDPCAGPDGDGNCSESCNEGADNCAAPDPNGSACADGLFCNGTDTCNGGSCANHAGDPCVGADGDGNCSESCDEGADNCAAPDPNGSACTDGLFCNGTDTCGSGTCSTHTGDPCAGGPECNDSCNEGPDNCFEPAGETCTDDGNVCTTDECDGAGACDHPAGNAGTECRASGGVCDVAESCDGASTTCPADGFVSAATNAALGGTASQSSTDGGTADLAIDGDTDGDFGNGSVTQTQAESEASWDVDLGSSVSITNIAIWNRTDAATAALSNFYVFVSDDPFTGTSVDDSLNQAGVLAFFQSAEAGTPSVIGVGDTGRYVRVQLTGGDALTLAEVVVSTGGTSCRAGAGACDAEEFCDGTGADCPSDTKLETECRGAAGVCDVAESCDGVGDDCPSDAVEPATTECRASAGVCDVADNCDGVGVDCTADVKVANGTECRASDGICDPAEACDGVGDDCPADAVEPASTVCRPSAGDCDLADNCDGVNDDCTADVKVPGGTECRASDGACDPAEACDGSGNDCPADAIEPNGTVCRPEAGDCDIAETCDGASDACPADVVETAGNVCRPEAGGCDVVESCDGSSAACPADAVEPAGNECRASAGVCDPAEQCNGSSNACPGDALSPAGTVCRPAADPECDFDEECTGSAVTCPGDVTQPDGLACDDEDGGTSNETCVGGLCGCIGDDLDGDTITDNCDLEDAQVTIDRASAYASGDKPGRVNVRGILPVGVYGAGDEVDISNGLTFAMVDPNDMEVVAPFLASECVERSSGLIKCSRRITSTQKWKLTLRPKKEGGVFTGNYLLKAQAQGFDVAATLSGPVTASVTHGFIDRVGSKACVGGPRVLICR
jgi:hypothetical protein